MIEYEFTLPDDTIRRIQVDDLDEAAPMAVDPPAWTALDFCQCENCPLSVDEHPHCPTAVRVSEVADDFRELLSYERIRVRVRVRGRGREYEIVTDAQTGLSSLLGLLMALSDCPHLSNLRGLARFHLPFADLEETLFRTASLYLLRQYFIAQDGGQADFDLTGLQDLYNDLQRVNMSFKQRILAASERDANINAVNQLFSLSALVSFSLESGLDRLRSILFPEMAQAAEEET